MPRLENWTLIVRTDLFGNTYQKIIGDIYNHPRANIQTGELCDGCNIITHRLINPDLDSGVVVTIDGTVYELGIKSDIKEL